MTKPKRKKNTIAAARWRSEIEPVAKFAAAHRGFSTALVLRLEARFKDKSKNWRVMLSEWLAASDHRRAEPLSGTGLVLLDEARQLMKEWR